MKTATPSLVEVWTPKRPGLIHVLLCAVACVALGATYMLATLLGAGSAQGRVTPIVAVPATAGSSTPAAAQNASTPARTAGSKPAAAPSAAEFAHQLAGTANAFAIEHGEAVRLANVHCVQASPGRYMCAYATKQPGSPSQCHVMQARWTPHEASTFTITLAGRAARCGSLRQALRTMR